MKNTEYIYLPISYEYMMSFLFGKKNYHGHVGRYGPSTWKKDLLKINKYIKKAIRLNVNSDAIQKELLFNKCDELEKKLKEAKTIGALSTAFVESYTQLIFQLLGKIPHHWDDRAPWPDSFWDLSGYRKLNYEQNNEQKAAVIIYAVDTRKFPKLKVKGFKDMREAFYQGCRRDLSVFIQWFKDNYPKEYCKLF